MKLILKSILILFGIGLLLFIGYFVYLAYTIGAFDKDYSVTDLKNNFEKRKKEIYTLKKYYSGIVPKTKCIGIEFENNRTIGILRIVPIDSMSRKPKDIYFYEYDMKINSTRTDSIITSLGWTKETIKELKKKLDDANCIGIENGNPTKINYQRSGLGMYSFNLFDQPISGSLRKQYNDSCTYILINDSLSLEYGGGAIGQQCFYNME
jgi:hypothetical protein